MKELEKYFKNTDGVASFLTSTILKNGQIQYSVFTSPYKEGNLTLDDLKNRLKKIDVNLKNFEDKLSDINFKQLENKENLLQILHINKNFYDSLKNKGFILEHDILSFISEVSGFKIRYKIIIDDSITSHNAILTSNINVKYNELIILNGNRYALHPNYYNEAVWLKFYLIDLEID